MPVAEKVEFLIQAPQGYVEVSNDGNFVVRRLKNVSPTNDPLSLDRKNFALMFGRIPNSGIRLRADVFIRQCRLAGVILYFDKTESEESISGHYDRFPIIASAASDTEAYGLFLNDEGNFYVAPWNADLSSQRSWTLQVPIGEFESMFGTDPRDYFANEVIRILRLAGYDLFAKKG